MITPARQYLTDYVINKATQEPITTRVKLYRALAAELPGKCPQFRALETAADELEAIERRTEQLLLNIGGPR